MSCKKQKLTEEEAFNIVDRDFLQQLNTKMNRRPQVHYYSCKKCKAYHTTTIPYSVFKNLK